MSRIIEGWVKKLFKVVSDTIQGHVSNYFRSFPGLFKVDSWFIQGCVQIYYRLSPVLFKILSYSSLCLELFEDASRIIQGRDYNYLRICLDVLVVEV